MDESNNFRDSAEGLASESFRALIPRCSPRILTSNLSAFALEQRSEKRLAVPGFNVEGVFYHHENRTRLSSMNILTDQ